MSNTKVEYTEQMARDYVKNLIISKSPLKDKALERFKKRFGHPFWESKVPNRRQGVLDMASVAETIFNGK